MANIFSKRAAAVAFFVLVAGVSAHACILTYTLVGPDGQAGITPGRPAEVVTGGDYRIEITMREDHNRCLIEPEDTMFLLEEARWRVNRETQPLVLLAPIEWVQVGSREFTATIEFRAAETGAWTIDVIRDCTKGGYHEKLILEAG